MLDGHDEMFFFYKFPKKKKKIENWEVVIQ